MGLLPRKKAKAEPQLHLVVLTCHGCSRLIAGVRGPADGIISHPECVCGRGSHFEIISAQSLPVRRLRQIGYNPSEW